METKVTLASFYATLSATTRAHEQEHDNKSALCHFLAFEGSRGFLVYAFQRIGRQHSAKHPRPEHGQVIEIVREAENEGSASQILCQLVTKDLTPFLLHFSISFLHFSFPFLIS
ncbi:MAG: hypothetical protein ACREQK_09030 [Candidatus Binatia bacterium]